MFAKKLILLIFAILYVGRAEARTYGKTVTLMPLAAKESESLQPCKTDLQYLANLKYRLYPTTLADSTCQIQQNNIAVSANGKMENFSPTAQNTLQMAFTGVPLVITGFSVKNMDVRFRSLRNDFMPNFHCPVDNYLQYLPAAVMVGMKACGVESRSSWSRMLVSDAFSAALMGGIVFVIKNTAQVERPDGSNHHSFPSGHTATAFMTATMLNKEYGYKSPWVGIGAYSAATATGLMRIANNKHWLSDVLAGAGIGIITTEIGYLLADLIFKEKGINHAHEINYFSKEPFSAAPFRPSFLGVYLGLASMPGRYRLPDGRALKFLPGSSAGIEGAYFFNPYIGFGGSFGLSSLPLEENIQLKDNNLSLLSVYSGAHFSYPVMDRLLLGGNISIGYLHSDALRVEEGFFTKRNWFAFRPALSLTFRAKEHLGVKLFARYELLPDIMPEGNPNTFHQLTFGAAASILFPASKNPKKKKVSAKRQDSQHQSAIPKE